MLFDELLEQAKTLIWSLHIAISDYTATVLTFLAVGSKIIGCGPDDQVIMDNST